jgi:FdhD protein
VAARAGVVATSCGTCGTSSVDDVVVRCPPVAPGPPVARSVVLGVPEQVRAAQPLFDRTGGVHAAAEVAFDGAVVAVREDVGRHNAVDKVVGRAALAGSLPLAGRVLALSGRVAFELVQKAAIAGFPVVVAVGAPTSLAVDAASRLGVTLVGFVRDGRANVYSHPERIDHDA